MAEKKPDVAKAPPGFAWLYNRLPTRYEGMFDLKLYSFEAGETRLVPSDVATFLNHNSVIKVDLTTSKGVRALVPQIGDDEREHPEFGVPYNESLGDEVIDRSLDDNPMQRGTGGLKTRAVRVPVGTKPKE